MRIFEDLMSIRPYTAVSLCDINELLSTSLFTTKYCIVNCICFLLFYRVADEQKLSP